MKLLCLLAVSLWLAGCSSYGFPVRDDNQNACEPGEPTDPRAVPLELASPSLVDIQLTSAGELVDRCLWTKALLQLTNGDVKDERSKIVLLHVHGWKENADPENEERDAFREILAGIAQGEQAAGSNKQVVGLFVAWPAATYAVSAMNNLNFLSRLNVADRISQSAIVAKLIGAVDSILDKRQVLGKEDIFILLGYSLGARILFNATAQVLLYDAQRAFPDRGSNVYSPIDGPGDLVILLNPAVSASNYTALDSIRRNSERFPVDQQPVMLTIASDTDLVNRWAYAASRWISFDWRREERTAIGEYPPFMTHRLSIRPEPPPPANDESAWFDRFCADSVCLVRQSATEEALSRDEQRVPSRPRQPSNPFIVAKAHPEVIDGHSDVWTSQVFSQWLGAFIEKLLAQRKQLRQAGR